MGDRALDEAKDFYSFKRSRSQTPSTAILVVQFLFKASDLATEVTPKANSTCENETQGAQRRPSTKRVLFSDQYSELDDETTSLLSRYKLEEDVFSFNKQAFVAQFLFSLKFNSRKEL